MQSINFFNPAINCTPNACPITGLPSTIASLKNNRIPRREKLKTPQDAKMQLSSERKSNLSGVQC
jgi:hypothetical protein